MSRNFTRASRLAFVSAGRLGSSLALAAQTAGYKVTAVSSRRPAHREWLASRLPGTRVTERAVEAAGHADIVFITASDDAVATVCRQITWRPGQAAVHCAGALQVSALDHAAVMGAATGGLHPLQTFPSPGSSERLNGITLAIESADKNLAAWLRQFATDLGGAPFDITPGQRAAYHASAVMASGLIVGLAGLAAEMWAQFGVRRDRALASLMPLIESTAMSLRERGLPAAVTGPYVRGDVQTVSKHLGAVAAQSPDVARAYAALALAQMHIAAEQGNLSHSARQAIEGLLKEALEAVRPSTKKPGNAPGKKCAQPARQRA